MTEAQTTFLSAAEIGRRPQIGVTAETVFRWTKRCLFPQPDKTLRGSRGWRWSLKLVEDWEKGRAVVAIPGPSRSPQHKLIEAACRLEGESNEQDKDMARVLSETNSREISDHNARVVHRQKLRKEREFELAAIEVVLPIETTSGKLEPGELVDDVPLHHAMTLIDHGFVQQVQPPMLENIASTFNAATTKIKLTKPIQTPHAAIMPVGLVVELNAIEAARLVAYGQAEWA